MLLLSFGVGLLRDSKAPHVLCSLSPHPDSVQQQQPRVERDVSLPHPQPYQGQTQLNFTEVLWDGKVILIVDFRGIYSYTCEYIYAVYSCFTLKDVMCDLFIYGDYVVFEKIDGDIYLRAEY